MALCRMHARREQDGSNQVLLSGAGRPGEVSSASDRAYIAKAKGEQGHGKKSKNDPVPTFNGFLR
jgi:hypothetical protein